MSMLAFCASRVSWISTGSARALISWSLPLPLGYCSTETSVIVPSATVSSTWTGPQRVDAVSPVTVAEPVVDVPDDDVPDDAVPEDAVPDEVLSEVVPDVVPVPAPPVTGATAEDCPPAAACDDVDVW